jgi:hypothetical protein
MCTELLPDAAFTIQGDMPQIGRQKYRMRNAEMAPIKANATSDACINLFRVAVLPGTAASNMYLSLLLGFISHAVHVTPASTFWWASVRCVSGANEGLIRVPAAVVAIGD